jgi:AcrR family transcriptional regulator
MPRPKKVSDADIAIGLGRLIGKHGPAKFTLARLAQEVGLAPATLVQRFGSKKGLILKAWSSGAGDSRFVVEQLRARGLPPLAIVKELYLCLADLATSPTAYLNHLAAYLQLDLGDSALRAHAVKMGRANDRLAKALLDEALGAGALTAATDTGGLARALSAATTGSLLAWATHRQGPARAWLERDLDFVLRPCLVADRSPVRAGQ